MCVLWQSFFKCWKQDKALKFNNIPTIANIETKEIKPDMDLFGYSNDVAAVISLNSKPSTNVKTPLNTTSSDVNTSPTPLGGGSIWDFAASSVIQREAGGFNSNYYGQALDLNREDSSFMNHQGVIFKSHQALDIK